MDKKRVIIIVLGLMLVAAVTLSAFRRTPAPPDGHENIATELPALEAGTETSSPTTAPPSPLNRATPVAANTVHDREDVGAAIFPDGRLITPTWYPSQEVPAEVLRLRLDKDYAALTDLALRGNAFAARFLADVGGGCEDAPESAAELEARIDELQQTQGAGFVSTQWTTTRSAEEVKLLIHMLTESLDRCREYREAIAGANVNFLQIAADNGHSLSMLDYANYCDPRQAREYRLKAWRSGRPHALRQLSRDALERYDSGEDPAGLVKAAAYHAAFSALQAARVRRLHNDVTSDVREYNAHTAVLFDRLLPRERADAVDQAIDLIRDNPNCCLSY